jgi:thiamine phosphate synthase YjbQ (UPF0047 family)
VPADVPKAKPEANPPSPAPMNQPTLVNLSLRPNARTEIIDVAARVNDEAGDVLARYKRALYVSYHTTAGYLEQALAQRLRHQPETFAAFITAFQKVFPANAPYRHDDLDQRTELSAEQKATEPRNADSHLTFMGSGLRNLVTYTNRPAGERLVEPVYFVELDGTYEGTSRQRKTSVLAYDEERRVIRVNIELPVSRHPIDSINLADRRLGFFEQLDELIAHHGVAKGRIAISLGAEERNAGLTVNEYETLLMQHDLAEVLRNPIRFMAEKGRHALHDPRAVPAKTINYAKYDMVRVFNEVMTKLGISESALERLLSRFIAVPASRFLRMKRDISFLVTDPAGDGRGALQRGTYQSPILVQWSAAERETRRVDVVLTEFE